MSATITPTPATALYEKQECDALDNSYIAWSASGIVFGLVSGGSGITTALVPTTPKYITGGISLLLAVGSGLSGYMAQAKAQQYASNCTVDVGGK